MKKKTFIALLLAAALCLTGCNHAYSRSELKYFAWKTLNYNPFFTMSSLPEPVHYEGDYAYKSYVVKTIALDPLEFRVRTGSGWSLEWGYTYLATDYYDMLLLRETEKFGKFEKVQVKTPWKEGLMEVCLEGEFSTREELDQIMAELTAFKTYLQEKNCDIARLDLRDGVIRLKLQTDYVNVYEENEKIESRRMMLETPGTPKQDNYYMAFLQYAIDNQLPFREDFSKQEIWDAVKDDSVDLVGFSKYSEYTGYTYYPDLCCERHSRRIGYKMLYEILQREEIPVTGSQRHFYVQDIIDRTWEFSLDFVEFKEDGKPNFYHLKDGEKIDDGVWPQMRIEKNFFELTGSYLKIKEN